jgi:hypothetical protein
MMTEPESTRSVRARLITEAMMGPTQGVQTSPRLKPTGRPPQKPLLEPSGPAERPELRPKLARRAVPASKSPFNPGTSMTRPKSTIRATAARRMASGGMPRARTIADRARVKNVKPSTKPAITPKGLALPFPKLPERTIGSRGRMQGERIVITPETKAKRTSTAITRKYCFLYI